MIREPFGDPPLSRGGIGFIILDRATNGDRSSIGISTLRFAAPRMQREKCSGASMSRQSFLGRGEDFFGAAVQMQHEARAEFAALPLGSIAPPEQAESLGILPAEGLKEAMVGV